MANIPSFSSYRLRNIAKNLLNLIRFTQDYSLHHPVHGMMERAFDESLDYIAKFMPSAIGCYDVAELHDIAIDMAMEEGFYMEFGVYSGGSINYFAKRKPQTTFHGFDSFEGLPESWFAGHLKKGTFSKGGREPKVRDNVKLWKGWFDETLPKWLEDHTGDIAFLHVDCDLYKSTRIIFDALGNRISSGTIIVFDEYFNHPHWEQGEFQAFQEFVKEQSLEYEYVAYSKMQVAVRIQ
jgi:Methyltransferase domain